MKMKSPLELLVEARALIAEEDHWTRYEGTRDVNDAPVSTLSKNAVKFCGLGALDRVSFGVYRECKEIAYAELLKAAEVRSFGKFNDESLHKAVLAAYDRAIASFS